MMIKEDEVTVRMIARNAADYIREYGWCQGAMTVGQPPGRPRCIVNAAFAGQGYDPKHKEEFLRRCAQLIGGDSEKGWNTVVLWNDNEAKPGEALALLERVANGEGAQ